MSDDFDTLYVEKPPTFHALRVPGPEEEHAVATLREIANRRGYTSIGIDPETGRYYIDCKGSNGVTRAYSGDRLLIPSDRPRHGEVAVLTEEQFQYRYAKAEP